MRLHNSICIFWTCPRKIKIDFFRFYYGVSGDGKIEDLKLNNVMRCSIQYYPQQHD